MQGFLLILQSCNNLIIEHWDKSLSWTTECVKKEKSILSKQCRVAEEQSLKFSVKEVNKTAKCRTITVIFL